MQSGLDEVEVNVKFDLISSHLIFNLSSSSHSFPSGALLPGCTVDLRVISTVGSPVVSAGPRL